MKKWWYFKAKESVEYTHYQLLTIDTNSSISLQNWKKWWFKEYFWWYKEEKWYFLPLLLGLSGFIYPTLSELGFVRFFGFVGSLRWWFEALALMIKLAGWLFRWNDPELSDQPIYYLPWAALIIIQPQKFWPPNFQRWDQPTPRIPVQTILVISVWTLN